MKLKNKLKLGALGLVSGVAISAAYKKLMDNLIKTHLSREGIQNPHGTVMSKKNQEDF